MTSNGDFKNSFYTLRYILENMQFYSSSKLVVDSECNPQTLNFDWLSLILTPITNVPYIEDFQWSP